jgi:hypothetical protein
MNPFERRPKQRSHPVTRRLPTILNAVAMLSLARRIGFRRASRLVELAATMYVADRKRKRRSMRRA